MHARIPIGLGMVLLLCGGATPAAAPGYHVAKRVVLGGEGHWDYLLFDPAGQRLFIARENRVMVVDPVKGVVLAEIPGLKRAHGIALADEAGRGFATSGSDGMVTMFDWKTLKVLGRIPTEPDDDAVLYDPASKRIVTFNGGSRTATEIDPAAGRAIGRILLDGEPEFGVASGDGRLYVNLEDTAEVAEISTIAMRVIRRWSIAPCASPTGLAIDRAHHRLFSGCRNKVMAISDTENARLLTTLPIGEGVDGCAFDPATQLAFASNGDGTLTVVHEDNPDAFRVVANVATRRGARTMALDETTHRIFTVTADLGPPPASTTAQPHPRPGIVPGTFTLLVLEP